MKKVFRKTSLLLATALMGVTGMQAQKLRRTWIASSTH